MIYDASFILSELHMYVYLAICVVFHNNIIIITDVSRPSFV